MSFRDNIKQRRAVGIGAFVALCLLCVIVWWGRASRDETSQVDSGKIWLTADDGKTWFPEDGAKIPPVMINGKEAVRCHVYTNDGGKTKYVLYLERTQPAVKKRIESRPKILDPMAQVGAVEVKRPGDTAWMPRTAPGSFQITDPKPGAQPVYPD